MTRAELFILDGTVEDPFRFRPVTPADLGSNGNGTGSATEAQQINIIAKNEEIRVLTASLAQAIAPATTFAPDLITATSSGSVAQGAKYVKFTFLPGTVATVLGQSIPSTLGTVEFPFNVAGYDAIAYTVTSGTIIITTVN